MGMRRARHSCAIAWGRGEFGTTSEFSTSDRWLVRILRQFQLALSTLLVRPMNVDVS